MQQSRYYILDGHRAVAADHETYLVWEAAHVAATRVAQEALPGGVWVSTVFLGWNHALDGAAPALFETKVFADAMDALDCARCSTWEAAEAQHAAMVAKWWGVPTPNARA